LPVRGVLLCSGPMRRRESALSTAFDTTARRFRVIPSAPPKICEQFPTLASRLGRVGVRRSRERICAPRDTERVRLSACTLVGCSEAALLD
jgi:hypothetical protein